MSPEGIMPSHASRAGAAAAVVLGVLLAGCTDGSPTQVSRTAPSTAARSSAAPSTPAPSASPDASGSSPAAPTAPSPAAGGAAPAPDDPPAVTDQAPAAPAAPAPGVPPAAAAPGARPVTVVTTFASWTGSAVEVGGYVDGLVENGGTCTLTLTRDGGSVSGTAPGLADASTTQCGVSVGGERLSAGMWRATLSYSSPNASGSATDVTIEVP